MTKLEITLLGDPSINLPGQATPLPLPVKGQALVFYLAITRQAASRQRLAGLLWSDQPEEEARRSLRVLLNSLQRVIPGLLRADRLEISLDLAGVQTDLERFWEGLRSTNFLVREQALEHFGGDLLNGFSLRGAALFEEWLAIERERLRQAALRAFQETVRQAFKQRQFQQGLSFAQKALALDPWDEDTHLQLMQLYTALGQRGAALRQYERCRDALAQELGLEPSPSLRQLYEQLRRAPREPESPGAVLPAHNLPVPLTRFLGRQVELTRLEELIHQNDCRLLTLTGPGGAGKTRLALALADQLLHTAPHLFPDGVYFVPLLGVDTPDGFWFGIGAAIGLELQPRLSPALTLRRYLRQRNLLLVLDNMEQLETHSGELVTLLGEAPGVKLLATSRVALGLYEEWVFEISGLVVDDSQQSEAAQLFLQVARRARLNFDLSAEWPYVQAICRFVNGLPLGIELAASWTRTLPASEIASLVERSQAALTTSYRDRPYRHTSLEAVFETSWMLLNADEQRALAGVAVFAVDFDLAAAEAITGATVRLLSRLVNASLIQRDPRGRFHLHPFIQECALAKNEAAGALREAHGKYFSLYLMGLVSEIQLVHPDALRQVEAELPNMRQMWQWAEAGARSDILVSCAPALAGVYDHSGRLQEGEHLLWSAQQVLAGESASQAILGVYLGWLQFRQGRFSEASLSLQTSLNQLRVEETNPRLVATAQNYLAAIQRDLGQIGDAMRLFAESGRVFQVLGDVYGQAGQLVNESGLYLRLGKHQRARELGQRALALFRTLDSVGLLVVPLANLGAAAVELGLYDEARVCFEEALGYATQMQMRLMIAGLHNHLGTLAIHCKQFLLAEEHLRHALSVAEEIGSLEILARICNDLGAMYERQGNFQAALPVFLKALETNRLTHNTFSIVINLNNLGFLERRLGQLEQAGQRHQQALDQAVAMAAAPLALDAVIGLAAVLSARGEQGAAIDWFAFVAQHPEADRQTQEELADVLQQVGIAPGTLDMIKSPGPDLAQAAETLRAFFR